jgi:tetratricopeptide (TPR) repeat protein
MRPLAIAAAVSTLVLFGAAPTAAPQQGAPDPQRNLTLDELREWATAVTSHEPGMADPAAMQIARWPPGRMYVLFTELRALKAFKDNPRVRDQPLDHQYYPLPAMWSALLAETLGLTPEERSTGNINRVLHRAALLHTDIALLIPNVVSTSPSPFSGRITIVSRDGQQIRLSGVSAHLEFSSWLLNGVRPDPSADEKVRAWYHAVAAILQRGRDTGDADWALGLARGLFPSDAVIQFHSGTLHETQATSQKQMVMRTASLPKGFTLFGGSAPQELGRAAGFFQRAIDVSPKFAEARLHLGRVNGLLGHHESAAALLTEAAAGLTDRTLQYYAALFLGREQDLLGDRGAALESFERAAGLYPRAQSPLLARSELARRMGDSSGALAPLDRLLALPGDVITRDDPWWSYDISHVRDAGELLSTWRSAFRGAQR